MKAPPLTFEQYQTFEAELLRAQTELVAAAAVVASRSSGRAGAGAALALPRAAQSVWKLRRAVGEFASRHLHVEAEAGPAPSGRVAEPARWEDALLLDMTADEHARIAGAVSRARAIVQVVREASVGYAGRIRQNVLRASEQLDLARSWVEWYECAEKRQRDAEIAVE